MHIGKKGVSLDRLFVVIRGKISCVPITEKATIKKREKRERERRERERREREKGERERRERERGERVVNGAFILQPFMLKRKEGLFHDSWILFF